jgi:4-amino-4-deoxy-L-arabinose transferase-like glycosyltransferase
MPSKRLLYTLWITFIALFAIAHALHLRADFPNFTPWLDWAKYTDEGWYGNAAVRAHLLGNWYVPGDFNPGPAVPVWPFLLWLLFFVTGVSITAARGMAVAFFFLNLFLSYKLFRERGPRWVGLLAVTLIVTSPFLYGFSRLAILEPMLIALTLGAMNLAIRLPRLKHQEAVAALIGLLFTGMMLTKTTAVFLLPALIWVIALPLWNETRRFARLARLLTAAGGSAALSFSLWMLLVLNYDLFKDYRYFFFINVYDKPDGLWGRILSFWWSFHGGLWVDVVLVPLAGLLILAAIFTRIWIRKANWRLNWTSGLWRDPLFSGSVLIVAGYIGFMTYQNHPQPRYFAVVAFFAFFIVVRVTAQLLYQAPDPSHEGFRLLGMFDARRSGQIILAIVTATAVFNAFRTTRYILHPDYTWFNAATNLTRFIDQHPNGNRLLVSISGDEITMITHLPSLCDDFGTLDLPTKLALYQPGWYAAWNSIDPGTLEDLHIHYNLEQVGAFPAFDDPDRNVLYLFKLHPLPNGIKREPVGTNLQTALNGDKINIPVE